MTGDDGASDLVPELLGGRYRLGNALGAGGMATVHAARDELLHRDVAVKVFATRATDAAGRRAQEMEARLAASLSHFALTTLYDAGVDHSDPRHPRIFLVLERVEGTDLRARLLEQGPLEPFQLAYLGFDLADALAHVHARGLLHRDVKPANVLLTERPGDERIRPKLTDFGISELIAQPRAERYPTGTAAYLSPEQVSGRRPVPASDVYALGLVLLEACTGRVAYPGPARTAARARLTRQPEVPESIGPETADLLRAMTHREPDRRPAPETVATAFQHVLVDEIVRRRALDPGLLPADEAERAAALRRTGLLDSSPEDAFDRVTRIASRLLRAPVALVNLIDVDRVWAKSRHGVSFAEVDRRVAFCSTTNPGTGTAWSVDDATADPRTRANPMVTGHPKVRAYAAAPLRTADGLTIGTLCVYDFTPRRFSRRNLADLSDLAGIVMRELDRRGPDGRAPLIGTPRSGVRARHGPVP